MKYLILIFVITLSISGCKDEGSVNINDNTFKADDYLIDVEEMPGIIGGIESISANIKYPQEAKNQGIEGKVLVKVYLDDNGKVKKTEIIRSDNELFDEAAVNAINKTEFTPGKNEGKAVKTQIAIPIVFKLGDKASSMKENKYPEYLNEVDEFPTPEGGMASLGKNIIYPEAERQKGIQGQVIVLALISETGDVIKTEIVEGVTASLDKAASDAIKRTKFQPAKKDGEKVKSQVQIPVTFKLN